MSSKPLAQNNLESQRQSTAENAGQQNEESIHEFTQDEVNFVETV